ncbi:hypothetical protein F4561_003009 [Lipingzhangella halophila]|uniref:Uncharacterized protein n=1 Tax=Lipingzhangella halophila TaxID=1783352 RepID=A0A7W7W3V2_9ACTN|nr:hypothetical protein [Lipingzhangella halophila]MBB4932189.1 hypothetical protein [Lipingzhangella halophila]
MVPDDRGAELRFEVEVATSAPEIDYGRQPDEDVAEEVDELFDNPEEAGDNPREPEVLSFASDTELDHAELDRSGHRPARPRSAAAPVGRGGASGPLSGLGEPERNRGPSPLARRACGSWSPRR